MKTAEESRAGLLQREKEQKSKRFNTQGQVDT